MDIVLSSGPDRRKGKKHRKHGRNARARIRRQGGHARPNDSKLASSRVFSVALNCYVAALGGKPATHRQLWAEAAR